MHGLRGSPARHRTGAGCGANQFRTTTGGRREPNMKTAASKRMPALLGVAAVTAIALALVVARGGSPPPAAASSHAEAPLISQDPRADNTDVYAFVSPDRPDTVTMIANYI